MLSIRVLTYLPASMRRTKLYFSSNATFATYNSACFLRETVRRFSLFTWGNHVTVIQVIRHYGQVWD